MVIVSRRVLLPFLAPPLAPSVFSVLTPNPIQACDTPSFLSATAPTGGFLQGVFRSGKRSHKQKEAAPNIALNVRT